MENNWIDPNKQLPEVFTKDNGVRFVKKLLLTVATLNGKGTVEIGRWYPDRFTTTDMEDWDDRSAEDFPWIEEDEKAGVLWLREGFYSEIECYGEEYDYKIEHVKVLARQYAPEPFKLETNDKEII